MVFSLWRPGWLRLAAVVLSRLLRFPGSQETLEAMSVSILLGGELEGYTAVKDHRVVKSKTNQKKKEM